MKKEQVIDGVFPKLLNYSSAHSGRIIIKKSYKEQNSIGRVKRGAAQEAAARVGRQDAGGFSPAALQ